MAVSHAERILRWFDELEDVEIPPEWMWPFPKELDRWFDDVKEARREKADPNGVGDDRERPSTGRSEWMSQNEYTAGIRR